jgi:hypothetical protein
LDSTYILLRREFPPCVSGSVAEALVEMRNRRSRNWPVALKPGRSEGSARSAIAHARYSVDAESIRPGGLACRTPRVPHISILKYGIPGVPHLDSEVWVSTKSTRHNASPTPGAIIPASEKRKPARHAQHPRSDPSRHSNCHPLTA